MIRKPRSRRASICSWFAAPMFISAMLLAWAAPVLAAHPSSVSRTEPSGSAQQQIQLAPGWNYISFVVIPDNLSLDVLFADVLSDIELIKDRAGAVYAPAYGIDQLSSVDPHQGYRVKALNPVSLTISGTAIEPETTPLSLDAGWNLIPYFRNEAMATDEALVSIASDLVRVEDGEGRVYPLEGGAPLLEALEPGQSYMVFVDQPVTLTYSPNSTPPSDLLEVNTLADALALTGLPAGQEVNVLGYYAPGDGGGGLFTVEDSGCGTDGGTCFGLDEHLSGEQVETVPRYWDPLNLAHSDVAFGTLSVEVINSSGSTIVILQDKHLHGHRWGNSLTQQPNVDYGGGILDDYTNYIYNKTGSGGQWRIRYKYLTSNLRLVRQNVGSTLDVHWFGAKTHDVDATFDNQPVICQTINAARARGNVTTILLSQPKIYEYFGSIELSDGLTLKGAGGTELVTATDDLGNTYHPVRVKAVHTRLRVKSGEALKHMRMYYLDETHPNYLPGDAKFFMNMRQSTIWTASGAMSGALEDIVLDGNWENNQDALQNPDVYGGTNALESELRNSPGWAGFVANNHGGNVIPLGQQVTVRNVAVLGYGSNGLLGHANNEWTGENVLLGNSVWNHVWYNAGGTWTNLTMVGFAWTHGTPSWSTVYNLVYEQGAISPYRPSNKLINPRVPDIYDDSETPEWPYMHSDGTWIPIGFTVDGFYIDGRGGDITIPFGGLGPNVVLKNGVYIHPGTTAYGFFYVEIGNGYQRALYPNNLIENVTIYETGTGRGNILGELNITLSTVRNVTVINGSSYTGASHPALRADANWRDHPAWQNRQTITYDGVIDESPRGFVLKTDVHPDAAGRDIYINNSSFDNQTNGIIVGPTHHGVLSEITGDPNKLSVFFDNVELNVGMDTYWTDLELFLNRGYFQNVTAVNLGRTSEDNGTIHFTASGGETYLDTPTNLFWVPEYVEVVEGQGASGLFDHYEVTHPNDPSRFPYKTEPSLRIHLTRSLNPGEAVTFTWSAAVHPFPGSSSAARPEPLFDRSGTSTAH